MEISAELNNYRLQGVIDFLLLGSVNAVAKLYDGTPPAFGDEPTGTLLATVALVEPLGTISAGALSITPTPEVLIVATGTPTCCYVENGEGTKAWLCTVSDLAGEGEIKVPSVPLYAGGYTRIVSGTLV